MALKCIVYLCRGLTVITHSRFASLKQSAAWVAGEVHMALSLGRERDKERERERESVESVLWRQDTFCHLAGASGFSY